MSSILIGGDPIPGGGSSNPLTITHTDTKFGNTAGVHSLTGVAAGALLVVTTGNQNSNQQCTVTSSPSLTFTRVVDNNVPNAEIFTATFVAGGAITVTVNWGSSVQSSVVYALINQDTVQGNGTNATLQPVANLNVSTTRTNSIIFCVSTNWNAPDAGAGGTNTIWRGVPTLSLYYRDVTAATFWHYRYDAAAIQAYNVGYTSPTDGDSGTGSAVLEVRSLNGTPPIPDTDPPNMGALSISGTPTHNSANITWGAATDNVGVTGYDIRVGTSSPPTAVVQSVGTGTLSATLTGLTPSTTYFVTVTAKDAAGNSDGGSVSNILSFTTTAAPANQNPTVPGNFIVTGQTSTTISVDWNASTDPDGTISSYALFRNGVQIDTVAMTQTNYTYVGLTPATTYTLRVRAVDNLGGTADTGNISGTTLNGPDTTNPVWSGGNLTLGTPTSNTIPMTWTAATDNSGTITTYQIHRIGAPSNPIGTVAGNILNFTATGLSPNTSYTFFIRAVDPSGNTADSNQDSDTTTTVPTCSGGTGIQVSFTPIPSNEDYSRYWGSSEFWGGGTNAQGGTIPLTMHRYRRFTWRDLEGDTQGSYRFNEMDGNEFHKFKKFFEDSISNRQLVSFGIMTCYPCMNGSFHDFATINNVLSPYPAYLNGLMAADGRPAWVSTACNSHWVPNYNAPSYIARHNALLAAIAAFLNTNSSIGVPYINMVGYIDIRGFGSWGEWHQNGTVLNNVLPKFPTTQDAIDGTNIINGNNWDGGNYRQMFVDGSASAADNNLSHVGSWPSFTRIKQIIDMYKTNFPTVPLAALMAAYDANFNSFGSIYGTGWENTLMHTKIGRYILDNDSGWGKIAIRRDQWGDGNGYYQLPTNTSGALNQTGDPARNITTRWQYAGILGEPPGYCVDSMTNFPNEVNSLHGSLVGNSNYGQCSIDLSSMETGFELCGCRLRPTAACVDLQASNLVIRTNWENFGKTAQFNHWNLIFQLRNSGGSLVWTSTVSGYDPFMQNPGVNIQNTDSFPRPVLQAGSYTLSMSFRDPLNYRRALQLGIQGRQNEGPQAYYNLTTLNF